MKKLYLTAILPPLALSGQIDQIRRECSAKFKVYAGLKPPVHITLHPPFWLPDDREMELQQVLQLASRSGRPFQVSLGGFDRFDAKVLFIHVRNSPPLQQLQEVISALYEEHDIDPPRSGTRKAYHPHITIAYRDIPAAVFPELWASYRQSQFDASFQMDHFTLLQHDGKQWHRYRDYVFQIGADSNGEE